MWVTIIKSRMGFVKLYITCYADQQFCNKNELDFFIALYCRLVVE